MKTKFNGTSTNPNRSAGGSAGGLAGRAYPVAIATRLNNDRSFCQRLCERLGKRIDDFECALAGNEISAKITNITGGGEPVTPKTNLRIIWKNGECTNFRVKKSAVSQIHLEKAEHFIVNFEAQFHQSIPKSVREALLLFTASHPHQKQILDAISEDYVGYRVRTDVERKYNSRLTLASMYGYAPNMVPQLLQWLSQNTARLFQYCFSTGAAANHSLCPHYLWYYQENPETDNYEIIDLEKIFSALETEAMRRKFSSTIGPGDDEQIGSTINLPFGNLQYHLGSLQFRHNKANLENLHKVSTEKKKTFGSRQKISGHQNELLIAKELNENVKFRRHFCEKVGREEKDFLIAVADGGHAKKVDSVLGSKKTTAKTDLVVSWKDGSVTNVSIKKNPCGQVYLVSARNFISAFEAQFQIQIPSDVRRALELFIGEAEDSCDILAKTPISTTEGIQGRNLANHQNYRLFFEHLKQYNSTMAMHLLEWLKDNSSYIFHICFAAGAVKDRNLWSHLLWYKNLVDVEGMGLDYMVSIDDLSKKLQVKSEAGEITISYFGYGSSLHLPFGHLQYHQKQLEFYHELKKIVELLDQK